MAQRDDLSVIRGADPALSDSSPIAVSTAAPSLTATYPLAG
jgi:hypothetical protein